MNKQKVKEPTKDILFKFLEDVGKFKKGTLMVLESEATAKEYIENGWGEIVEEKVIEPIQIPERLKSFNFVIIDTEKGDGKKPLELGWQKKFHRFDDPKLIKDLNEGKNYGVQCNESYIEIDGEKKFLVIIDFDRKDFQDKVLNEFPETFTTSSGSDKNCFHLWLVSDNNKPFKIKDKEGDMLSDMLGAGNQIIAPGSTHHSGSKYHVVKDIDFAFMPYSQIEAILKPHDETPKKVKKHKKVYSPKGVGVDLNEKIINSLSMEEVLNHVGIDNSKNPTNCFDHSSKGGKCFSYNDETSHCFHCDGSWNKFSLIREAKKLTDKETFEWFAEKGGLQDELAEARKEYINLKKDKKVLAEELKAKKIEEEDGDGDPEKLREAVLTLIALKKPREATEKIMESFMNKNYIYSTRDDEKSEMWIYDNGIYIPQGKTFIKEFCGVVLGKVFTTQLANEVIEKIRVKTYIDQDEFFRINYVDEIPILDGILNLRTREVSSFTPEKIFFSKLPLNYVPEQQCPKIDQFLNEVLSCGGDVKVVEEIFGSLLEKDYKIEKAIMLNGGGRNGKTKTTGLMENFVGSENTCNVGIGSMQKDNFDLEDLFGKLLNIGGDTGKTSLKDTGCFKELTGRDGVNLKRKFKRTLRFVNYAKHIFPCNDLPIVYDNTLGFWSKWVLIDFPYEFMTKEEIEKLPELERVNKKIINQNILKEISTQDELNGLLNKALDGLDRLRKNKDFSFSKGTNYIKKTWKRRANSFLAFCEDCIEEDETESIIKIKMKKAYGEYCKKHNLKTKVGEKTIKSTLENEYFVEEVRDLDRNYLWRGIKFKEIPMLPTHIEPIGNNLILPKSENTIGNIGSNNNLKGNLRFEFAEREDKSLNFEEFCKKRENIDIFNKGEQNDANM